MTKTIVITSGKGGVGKTNISVNTALELYQRKYRTCLFDADLGLANVDLLLGLHPKKTLDDCIFGEKQLDEIILHSQFGIDIIPGSSGIEKMTNLNNDHISGLLSSFSTLSGYDYLLIDTSSGISRGVISFCLASSETMIVITSEFTSLTDAYSLLKVMASNGYKGTVKIIVNRCPSVQKSKETYLRYKAVADKYLDIDIALAGIILNDPNMETAVARQEPVLTLFPDSVASQCIRAMVSNLIKGKTEKDSDEHLGEFWQRYINIAQSDITLPGMPSEKIRTLVPMRSPAFQETDSPPLEISPPSIPQNPIRPFSQSGGIMDPMSLPSPTIFLSHYLKMQERGELSKEGILEIFTLDPALMTKALHMLFKPGTIAPKRVTKRDGIAKGLGTEVLSNLLLTSSMRQAMCDHYAVTTETVNDFWYHSYKCALLAESIAEQTDYPHPEEAYLTGLIHDIGRLALQTNHPEVYAQSPDIFRHEDDILQTEKRIFGKTHAHIGATFLRSWNLNSFMVDAVQYHGDSKDRIETALDLVQIVYLAGKLSMLPREDLMAAPDVQDPLCGLSSAQLLDCIEKVDKKLQQTTARFQLTFSEVAVRNTSNEAHALLKRQAADYSLLQSVLPPVATTRESSEIIHMIHQGIHILFGIRPVICLLRNTHKSSLQVMGHQKSSDWDSLSDISISLRSKKSSIVDAFTTQELKISTTDDSECELSLADEQILQTLDSHGLVCVPLVAHDTAVGILLFGIQQEELQGVWEKKNRLVQFGGQSARNILAFEQLSGKEMTTTPASLRENKDSRGNLHRLVNDKYSKP